MVPMLQRWNRIGDVLRPLKRGTSRAALVWFLCRSKLGLVRVEGASGASIWYEGHPPLRGKSLREFSTLRGAQRSQRKAPTRWLGWGLFLAARGLKRAAV